MAGRKYVKKTTVKKYTKSKKSTTGSKRPSGAMGAELMKLKRQVAKLTKVAIQRIQYACDTTINCYNASGLNDYNATPMMKFNNWSRIFGTDADDESAKQVLLRSMKIQWHFTTNEPDNRDFSIFLVSLKDNASELLLNDGTLDTLVSGTHFHSARSLTLLNLNFFNIHYHRRFTAGVYPMVKSATLIGSAPGVQNIPNVGIDTQRLGSTALNFGKGIVVKNPAGDWKAGVYPKDPSKNYYFLTFWSGDSAVDAEFGQIILRQLTQVDSSV